MTGLALLCLGIVGFFAAWLLYGIWIMGMDTYAEATWWLFPPLVFVSTIWSVYCFGTLLWRGLGLHVEVSM